MILCKNSISRLGIYSFYDKEGFVDKYVQFFLNDYVKNLDTLIIVSNNSLLPEERDKFLAFTDIVIERENKGFDIWGYKTGLDYVGWEKLEQYDEVVVANNTMMGPVYPFSEMFQEMAGRDLDFWGITRHYSFDFDPFESNEYGYIPEHIQSNFVVFRSSFVDSKDFQNYWDNLPQLNTYEEAVGKHESSFTKRFADKGYKWDTYVDTEDIKYLNQYPLMVYPKLLIQEKKCPIFKRRTFFQPYDYVLNNSTGQPAVELMDFLVESGLYDVNMIWDNLLRTCNQADLVKNLQLRYVLPSNIAPVKKVEEELKTRKIALVMHLYFEDLVESSFAYAQSMPESTDIYITTDTEKKKKCIEKKFAESRCKKVDVRVIENRGRDVSSILVGVKDVIMDYDIACFVHDKKTAQLDPGSVGEAFAYKCFENTLHNDLFVYNVINTFIENPRLGILSPPVPNHSDFFPTLGLEWGQNFENTKELAESLGIHVPMDENKEPIAPLGTFFWFRPQAFRYLYNRDWEYCDFPKEPNNLDGTLLHAVERVYPYAAQQAGFYPAVLLVDKYASIELNNLEYYVREYNKVLLENHMGSYQHVMVNNLRSVLGGNETTPIHKQLEECMEIHKHVCEEWTATAKALKDLEEVHSFACEEWKKTAEQLKEMQSAHKLVCEEWEKTAEQLKEVQSAHDYVCEEWEKTARELEETDAKYQNVVNSLGWRIISKVNYVIDKMRHISNT